MAVVTLAVVVAFATQAATVTTSMWKAVAMAMGLWVAVSVVSLVATATVVQEVAMVAWSAAVYEEGGLVMAAEPLVVGTRVLAPGPGSVSGPVPVDYL